MIIHKNPLIVTLTVLSLLIFPMNSTSQAGERASNNCPVRSLTQTVCDDALHIASSPFRMSKQDVIRLSVFAAVTTGCIAYFDVQIRKEFMDANEDHFLVYPGRKLARAGSVYDRISPEYFFGGLTTGMLAGGLIFKDSKLLTTTGLMVESYFFTIVITACGKQILSRSRPYTGRGPHDFNLLKFSGKTEYSSMPSGHTSSVFSMMTVISREYNHWWIKIPAYTLCVSVALQRIDADKHWTSDVIAGGALGYWVGSTLVSRRERQSATLSFHPYWSGNRAGIAIDF
jgi:membrane-associated phospholipid phosphatase